MNYYLLFKSFHLISVISWMAGLLYLPRIFVYHAQNKDVFKTSEVFKVMEDNNTLTLGMNDYLGALANTMESHLYLLKQRVKEVTHGR